MKNFTKAILLFTTVTLFGCNIPEEGDVWVDGEKVNISVNPPEGSVILTIDDGVSLPYIMSNLDLFHTYNATATYYVSEYTYSMSNDLLELQNRGFDIGHHTQNHVSAIDYSKQYSAYKWFADEVSWMLRDMSAAGLDVKSFAYPFGQYTMETNEVLKPHFTSIRLFGSSKLRTYEEGFYKQDKIYFGVSVDSLWLYKNEMKLAMDKAKEEGKNLVLAFHIIDDQHESSYKISREDLQFIMEYASVIGLPFKTMAEISQ